MNSKIIEYDGERFLDVPLLEVNQKGQTFYVGKILAQDMLNVFTVRPAKYDIQKNASLAKSFPSDKDFYEHLISKSKETISDQDFQRKFDPSRVSSIEKYIKENEYPFFPNTIIANCEIINDYEELGIDSTCSREEFFNKEKRPSHLSFLSESNKYKKLLIPYTEDSILIIDGQHRLEGLRKVDKDILSNYELIVSFLIGFDRSTIAQQFYTINYEQKPVNKSLLYHLTGEFSTDLNELTFLHNVVRILNELDRSPFYRRIKMLGVNPPNLSKPERNLLSVSQAFLIDQLIRTISKSSKNSIYQPIFLYFYLNEEKQIEIVRFLIKYFKAISNLISGWDNPNYSIISKGMGIGAFIKVLHLIFPKLFFDKWERDPERLQLIKVQDMVTILSGIENVDFSKEGKFGGVGSGGSINKIKEDIITELRFIPFENYNDFEQDFRENYLPRFKEWTNQIIEKDPAR